MTQSGFLGTRNHDRDSAGFRYVYPVVSRRAGGVSIGINLNPNNRCNWHCVYCQVPQLARGHAPLIDLQQLHDELHAMLEQIVHGDFMHHRVPEGQRRLCDIAFSGNGEPTSSEQFHDCVDLVIAAKQQFGLDALPLRLITNGSYMRKAHVQQSLQTMAKHRGETWIKVDGGDKQDLARGNGVHISPRQLLEHVSIAARLCPSWIQSCFYEDQQARSFSLRSQLWLDWLQEVKNHSIPIHGVLLYGLARPSMQPEADELKPLSDERMADLAARVRALGLPVQQH